MIDKLTVDQCCGCGTCMNICPKQAISMKKNKEGFAYPIINEDLCINCDLCEKKCPVLNAKENNYPSYAKICRDKRNDVLKVGTSGSFTTSVMEYVFSKKGVVYGAIYDVDNIVRHVRCELTDSELISKLPNSKYVQSDISGIFPKIKEDLGNGRYVLFVGTPCQCAGLSSYIGENNNLLKIDFACHGTPSPKLWAKEVEYLEKKFKSNISSVRFRNKTYGYHHSTLNVKFENGKEYNGSLRNDYYFRAFYEGYSSQKACFNCKFKNNYRYADFTLFECYNASELNEEIIDDDRGYTSVILRSDKAVEILGELNNLEIYDCDINETLSTNGSKILNCTKMNENRDIFYDKIDDLTIDKMCSQFYKIGIKENLIEFIKHKTWKRKDK